MSGVDLTTPSALRVLVCNCTPDEADSLARALVEERLAACVNIIPSIKSVYRWEGEVHTEEESTLLIKTSSQNVEALATRLVQLHSYDVPEVLVLTPQAALAAYEAWALDALGH